MRIYLLKLLFIFLLLSSFPEVIHAARIYGGNYSKERIIYLRNNCKKYEWARRQLQTAVERAKLWVEKSDET
jgi:hypothetical protein